MGRLDQQRAVWLHHLRDNGWAGIIIHGCVRDAAALSGLDVGIKAIGSSPRASGKAGLGEVDVPVTFGDVTFRPGDLLFSDEDGVVTLGADGEQGLRHRRADRTP